MVLKNIRITNIDLQRKLPNKLLYVFTYCIHTLMQIIINRVNLYLKICLVKIYCYFIL